MKIDVIARFDLKVPGPTDRQGHRSCGSEVMDCVLAELQIQVRPFVFIGSARSKSLITLTGYAQIADIRCKVDNWSHCSTADLTPERQISAQVDVLLSDRPDC